jgi:hypothetical protein
LYFFIAVGLPIENAGSARPARKDADGDVRWMTAVVGSEASQDL